VLSCIFLKILVDEKNCTLFLQSFARYFLTRDPNKSIRALIYSSQFNLATSVIKSVSIFSSLQIQHSCSVRAAHVDAEIWNSKLYVRRSFSPSSVSHLSRMQLYIRTFGTRTHWLACGISWAQPCSLWIWWPHRSILLILEITKSVNSPQKQISSNTKY